jgi:hypothetical protein
MPDRHVLPIGEQAAGGLRSALEQVAREAALSELVEILGAPAELVDQRTERKRRVDATTGDDDVRARI